MLRYRPNAYKALTSLQRSFTGQSDVADATLMTRITSKSAPDHMLTAFAQFCALRLDATNCAIRSVIAMS